MWQLSATPIPEQPALGPADIAFNFSFLHDPNATSARLLFIICGSPERRPVPTVPEPGTSALFGGGLGLTAFSGADAAGLVPPPGNEEPRSLSWASPDGDCGKHLK